MEEVSSPDFKPCLITNAWVLLHSGYYSDLASGQEQRDTIYHISFTIGHKSQQTFKMVSNLMILILVSSSFAHQTKRYSGSHFKQVSSPVTEEWFDSPGACANLCLKVEGLTEKYWSWFLIYFYVVSGCSAYSTLYYEADTTKTFRGYKCQIGGER